MNAVMPVIARLFLLLSLAVAPLYGVTAPLVMHDMAAAGSSQSQGHASVSSQHMQKQGHGCCDMAGGCHEASDCKAGCSSCGHCNVAAGIAATPFTHQVSSLSPLALAETPPGIVLPREIRPPQVF